MKSALGQHPIFLGAIVASTLCACGGAPSAGASSAASSASASSGGGGGGAAERCLAIASAKRERKPNEPYRITAKHVLVRYAGAKRSPATVTRTREQACLRAQEALAKLKEGTPFADVVRDYSEEPDAAAREGSIGSIQRTEVALPFADAAFELETGEVSDVVETGFGFHVILRVE
jgi:NIMA-interacting peptidyl-prolyl cis-trans isomerase 1